MEDEIRKIIERKNFKDFESFFESDEFSNINNK